MHSSAHACSNLLLPMCVSRVLIGCEKCFCVVNARVQCMFACSMLHACDAGRLLVIAIAGWHAVQMLSGLGNELGRCGCKIL